MSKPTLLALSIASSLLLTACGGASMNEQDTNNNNLTADTAPATESNLEDSIARETLSVLSKFLKTDKTTSFKLPSSGLSSSTNTTAPTTNTKSSIDAASLLGNNSFDADLGQFIKSLTGESLKLPLDVKSFAKPISSDASSNLCETGSATVLGQTDIDKANAKGMASLNFRFDNCVTKTDGNELTGDIELLVKLGLQDTDFGIELKDLDIVKEDGSSKVDGSIYFNINYKYLVVHKETFSWQLNTTVDNLTLGNEGTVIIDEFDNIKFSTKFMDKNGAAIQIDNSDANIFDQNITGTITLPNVGSLAISGSNLQFCPNSGLLKTGQLNLLDNLGKLIKITGNNRCDTIPMVVSF